MNAYIYAALGGVATLLLIISAIPLFAGVVVKFLVAGERVNDEILHNLYIADVSARQISILILSGVAVAAGLSYMVSGSLLVALISGLSVFLIPRMIFAHIRIKRLQRFEELLPSALDALSSSAKAGLSLAQAFEEVAASASPPVSEEFSLIVQDNKLGTELSEAITKAGQRIGGKTFGLVRSTLLVNIEKGGNLPEALTRMSESLKEVWRLEQKLITSSAEGRKAMLVISVVPVFICLMVMTLQPEIANTLTTNVFGMVILFAAGVLYVSGIAWLRSILNSDI